MGQPVVGASPRRARRSLAPSVIAERLTWSITSEGTWRHVSVETAKVLGFKPEELAGALLFDYLHPEELDRVARAHREALEGADQRITHRLRRGDGLYSWFETSTR